MYTMVLPVVLESPEASDPSNLELRVVGSCHVGAGNPTRALEKSDQCSKPWSPSFQFGYLHCVCMLCVYAHEVQAWHGMCMCGGQKTHLRAWFFPSAFMWDLETELKSPGPSSKHFICQAIFLAPTSEFWMVVNSTKPSMLYGKF